MITRGKWQLQLLASQVHFTKVKTGDNVNIYDREWYLMLIKWRDTYCYAKKYLSEQFHWDFKLCDDWDWTFYLFKSERMKDECVSMINTEI